MKIGIVGSGNIGAALGRLWAKAGHQIYFSFSRDRHKLERLAQEAGNDSQAATPYDAVCHSEVVLFSVPWVAQDEAIKQIGRFEDHIVIDTTNPFIDDAMNVQQFPDKDSSSEHLARKLEGAKLVKAFNTLRAGTLRDRSGQGLVVFCASNYPAVKHNQVAQLIRDAGFVPFDAGPLHEGKKQEPGTDRYFKEVMLEQAEQLVGTSPHQAKATTGEIEAPARKQTTT